MTSRPLTIRPAHQIPEGDLRAVIASAFDMPRSAAWFDWKHRDAPWGPSTGLVALDDRGAVGARILMPWHLSVGAEQVRAWRATEASTVPRAQGQGIFSRLNRQLMESLRGDEPALIFSTPNSNSRLGYAKLGWSVFPVVRHQYEFHPVVGRRARLQHGDDLIDGHWDEPSDAITTQWTSDSLRWRIDRRSGNAYEVSALSDADLPNGVVYRVIRRGPMRILLLVALWGTPATRRTLVHSVAADRRTPVVLRTRPPAERSRRYSELAVFVSGDWDRLGVDPRLPQAWDLSFCDVESLL